MQLNRYKTVEEFKAAFPDQLEQIDFSDIEGMILKQGGRMAVLVEEQSILSIFAEIHPNPLVTYLSCVANFAPQVPYDLFSQYSLEHKLGFLVVDVPAWLNVDGADPLSVLYRSQNAPLGNTFQQVDIQKSENLRKRLRTIRNSSNPYGYQIQLVGCDANEIEKGNQHLAALSYEPVRHQYAIN
jgi:hypothetical protein